MLGRISKPVGLVLILVVVIGAVCLFSIFSGGIGRLFGGGQDPLQGRRDPGAVGVQQGELGRMYTAVDVDQNGCPLETTGQFFSDESVFVGVEESEIPAGTTMFIRLHHEGQVVEDAPEVEANQSTLSCVWFEFSPGSVGGFEPGEYEAELFVNGNSVDSIAFEVSASGADVGALPGSGSSGLELGELYTTTAVDENGCPVDDVFEFFADESIYVSLQESFIPPGTEMFARLLYEGQVVEDTQPVFADQDLEACVWFEFQGDSSSGGLRQGDYEAEIYANGVLVDSIDFAVR